MALPPQRHLDRTYSVPWSIMDGLGGAASVSSPVDLDGMDIAGCGLVDPRAAVSVRFGRIPAACTDCLAVVRHAHSKLDLFCSLEKKADNMHGRVATT